MSHPASAGMENCTLGKTDLRVARVCLGTMTFGAQTDEATALSMVDRCFDRGVNFFDTANVYNAGASEVILGQALRGRRDQAIVATKCAGKMGPGPDESGLSPAAIRRAAEASLRRLQTDYIDLYYLHWPDYSIPIEESLGALDELVRAGKVRHVGASNYAAWQLCRMLWLADRGELPPVGVVQPMFNLLARGIETELLPMCREFGLGTVIYNPLAGGLLTGKQRFEGPLSGTRFDQNQTYLDRYWHEQNFAAVQELSVAARENDRTLVSLALNWALHHTSIDCVIVGASRLAHLDESLRAAEEGALPSETVAVLDRVWARLRGPSPKYNR